MTKKVFAAGTLPWREVTAKNGDKDIEVLLIYRKKYNDWSFPKGKAETAEPLPVTAFRETLEETGLALGLGVNLGRVNYNLKSGAQKTVAYWAAKVSKKTATAYTFQPNREIAEIAWLSIAAAYKKLSYQREIAVLERFEDLVSKNKHDTFALTLLRHAKAEPRSKNYPRDSKRPLTDNGLDHAHKLVPLLQVFKPRNIVSSDAKRCRSTVTPAAHILQLPLDVTQAISQETWDSGETQELYELVSNTVASQRGAILCSHRPVLPALVHAITVSTDSNVEDFIDSAAALPPGGISVFHITKKGKAQLVSVEIYPLEK